MDKLKFDDSFNKMAFILAVLFPVSLIMIHFLSGILNVSLTSYGIYPNSLKGLQGIFFSPFIHGSWNHVISNSFALFPLLYFTFFYYKPTFWKVLMLIILMSGFWTWIIGRPSFHIGASGVVNGLVVFLFVSGIIRKHKRLMGVSLIMVFMYGGILWSMFPSDVISWFLNERVEYVTNISWEAHLSGVISGIILSFYFKDIGLKKRAHYFDDSDLDDDNPYWLEVVENDNVE